MGMTLEKAQEAGTGQAEQSRDKGEDALLFTGKWQNCLGVSWSLRKTICFLVSSLGQGLEKEPEPRLPSVRERLQGSPAAQTASAL